MAPVVSYSLEGWCGWLQVLLQPGGQVWLAKSVSYSLVWAEVYMNFGLAILGFSRPFLAKL